MSVARIAVLMGSVSDREIMSECARVLDEFQVAYEMKVLSAHRTPRETADYVREASERGIRVVIAGAGYAAHLAGAVASHCLLPVIGVPLDSSPLRGIDALLATVEMPQGIPVACMGVGKAGAVNAALLACQILALEDPELDRKLRERRERERRSILSTEL